MIEQVAYVLEPILVIRRDPRTIFDTLFILRKIKSPNILAELVACVLEPILVG